MRLSKNSVMASHLCMHMPRTHAVHVRMHMRVHVHGVRASKGSGRASHRLNDHGRRM